MKKFIITIQSVLVILFLFDGCSSHLAYTRKLDKPIARNFLQPGNVSFLKGMEEEKSIGDLLFEIRRAKTGIYQVVGFKAPTGDPFPRGGSWLGTHVFNDGTSGDLIVWTNASYYKGQIGVILDEVGEVATEEPLVQMGGTKAGRRWSLEGRGPFFYSPNIQYEWWGVRYGGKIRDQYIFETVKGTKGTESSTSELLQTIKISEAFFLEGFTVRGVFIKGLSGDNKGKIRYRAVDKRVEPQ